MGERPRSFQCNLGAPLFALHVNLNERPLYSAALKDAQMEKAFMVILGVHFEPRRIGQPCRALVNSLGDAEVALRCRSQDL